MRLYDSRTAHWVDEHVLCHRVRLRCCHLWCWHVMCERGVTSRCRYCGRGGPR